MNSPRTIWRRRAITLWIVALPLLGALWLAVDHDGLGFEPPTFAEITDPAAPVRAAVQRPIDSEAFDIVLWHSRGPIADNTELADVDAASARVPPLEISLVGIIDHGNSFVAAVFDPASNAIRELAVGDSIASRRVMEISARQLVLHDDELEEYVIALSVPEDAP